MKYLIISLSAAIFLNANPQNHSVASGDANVSQSGNLMEINVSDRAILNWDAFSIQAGETTRFIQPSPHSAVLNRVTGTEMSEILGSLQAGGQVYLINPHGVVIGKEGRIDTAGFVSSVYEILNVDFLNGDKIKFQGDEQGEIINLGTISTGSGPVALIAHRVENSGTISAKEGMVSLFSGHDILLDPTGQGLLFIRPDLKGAGIENNGTIEAYKTELQADGTPTSLAIGLGGVIDAGSFKEVGGEIYLVAKEGSIDFREVGQLLAGNEGKIFLHAEKGTVEVNGHIETPTGEVRLLGEKILLFDTTSIDVSGDTGGGTVLVGGDYQGANPDIPNAQSVYLSKYAEIHADAKENGNGGKVILWGDLSNGFLGKVSANGGKEGGDGGFIEVSSMGGLCFEGVGSTLAPKGKAGMLLIDPTNVTITDFNQNITPGPTYMWTGTPVNISINTLGISLAGGNVVISTSSAADQGEVGDLTVTAPLSIPGPFALTLTADQDIFINNSVTCSGNGNLVLTAGNDIFINSGIGWDSSQMFSSSSMRNTTVSGSIISTSGVSITLTTLLLLSDIFVTGTLSTNGAGTINFFPANQLHLQNGCTLNSDAAITVNPSSFLNLSGTVTMSTPSTITLTSANQTPLVRGANATLNTTASSLTFPKGIQLGGLGLGLTVNETNGDVFIGSNINLAHLAINATGNVQIQGGTLNVTTNALTLNAGGNLILDDNTTVQIVAPSTSTLTLQSPSSTIQLGDNILIEGTGPVLLLAGQDITVSGTTGTIRTTNADNLTLVVDNLNPNPYDIGSGKYTIPAGYALTTGSPAKVLLFAATPTINPYSSFPATINGEPNDGRNILSPYWYLTLPPPDPPAFQIMYKTDGSVVVPPVVTPAVVQTIQIAVTEPVSNPPQITQITEGNLQPPSTPNPKTPCRAPAVAIQAL